jgi:hypothetical protein
LTKLELVNTGQSCERAVDTEFLALENARFRLRGGECIDIPDWVWKRGEQWAFLAEDGPWRAGLIEGLLGHAPLIRGELRGPSMGHTHAPLSTSLIAHLSPESHRQLALSESSFYQSRWHSGLGEGERTLQDFLLFSSVREINPFELEESSVEPRDSLTTTAVAAGTRIDVDRNAKTRVPFER